MAVQLENTGQQAVDATILKAIAGASAQVPVVGSRVYYFPQAHAEQLTPPPCSSLLPLMQEVLCQVLAVQYCVDPESDEVFVKIRLAPISEKFATEAAVDRNENDRQVKLPSVEKILSLSDAKYGVLTVPQACALSIFPPLKNPSETQAISITDVHGAAWEFQYICRGKPQRHLLTAGWASFINHKKLIAGDSVVFVKNQNGKVYVGITRVATSKHRDAKEGGVKSEDGGVIEVVYYPKATSHEYVVNAERVESSLKEQWTAGMRVRLRMDAEEDGSSRSKKRSKKSFEGVVSSAMHPGQGMWRMLEVRWNEPEMLSDMGRVSPWQVERVGSSSSVIANLDADTVTAVSPSAFSGSSSADTAVSPFTFSGSSSADTASAVSPSTFSGSSSVPKRQK